MNKLLLAMGGLLIAAGSDAETFTLYRSSAVIENARVHVATFDAEGELPDAQYNRTNCELAANLFQHQPGVETRFWCEKGTYRKEP